MDLVLFENAIDHICRISRILSLPRGSALLLGLGGSGKQSLARFVSFLCGMETFQINSGPSYGFNEYKADFSSLYIKTGVKGKSVVFLLADSQITDEKFLMYLNDFFATGNIPNLFSDEEKANIISQIKHEVRQSGLNDHYDSCWAFFLNRVRQNLHPVLCFSQTGNAFRVLCKRFPQLISKTCIDYFSQWPEEALISVASRFLQGVDFKFENNSGLTTRSASSISNHIAKHMSFVHRSVIAQNKRFLDVEKRYNYATPKSYLEFIAMYQRLLKSKGSEVDALRERLQSGIDTLKESVDSVDRLKHTLEQERLIVEEKQQSTERLLEKLGKDRAEAAEQGELARLEEERLEILSQEVQSFQRACKTDLDMAEPVLQAALDALNTLDRNNLTELKSFVKPPKEVVDVTAAVLILLSGSGVIETTSDLSWASARKAMLKVDQFLNQLIHFDKEQIPSSVVDALQPYLEKPEFTGHSVKSKSTAAAGLCEWVRNIIAYNNVFTKVQPKRLRLAEANEKLQQCNDNLSNMKTRVQKLESELKLLTDEFEKATNDKNLQIQQAEKTQTQLSLAERLLRALSHENSRWMESLDKLQENKRTLAGDALLTSAFITYCGPFSQQFRKNLIFEQWVPDVKERGIPLSQGINPLDVLADEAKIAAWKNEGLPDDTLSEENGAIITNGHRWPLIIDPQLQAIQWIRNRESQNGLVVLRLEQPNYLEILERCMVNGVPVLIEDVWETIDPVLEPLLSRQTVKKGRFTKLGDKLVEHSDQFRLYIQTKASNPHYKPELIAQTTLVNFTVTETGLEEQILAVVVRSEHPELEDQRHALLLAQNEGKIKLKDLEDKLLTRLSTNRTLASRASIEDIELIENLQATKREIEEQVKRSIETEQEINRKRDIYRPVASLAATLYFLISQLTQLSHMYQYSFASFMAIVTKTLLTTRSANPGVVTPEDRARQLINSITYAVYNYIVGGLFERHRLIFATLLTMKYLEREGKVDSVYIDFLVNGPQSLFGLGNETRTPHATEDSNDSNSNGPDWLENTVWNKVQSLGSLPDFKDLPNNIITSQKRWKDWYLSEKPEIEKLPVEYKTLGSFQKLLLLRCVRQDRLAIAITHFIRETMGNKYVDATPYPLNDFIKESTPITPILLILSPGVDPLKDVEYQAKKNGFGRDQGTFVNVALGEGQEVIATKAVENGFKNGGWVMLQNIHLTRKWLHTLEKLLDKLSVEYELQSKDAVDDKTVASQKGSSSFRLFLSSEPSTDIPAGLLQKCMKLTNEPPQGLKENLKRAVSLFSEEIWESGAHAHHLVEFKPILFSLCVYHSLVLERRKFGPQGWNKMYPFSRGDLQVCGKLILSRVEASSSHSSNTISWDELRFLVGEIMYGGHITDPWDRRLNASYLQQFIKEDILSMGASFYPGFAVPNNVPFDRLLTYIEENMPVESPTAFGMHSSAELGYRTEISEELLKDLLDMRPKYLTTSSGLTLQEKVKVVLDDILERLPENFSLEGINDRLDERGPFANVFLQECHRMNILLDTVRSSLSQLDYSLKGNITMSDKIEALMLSLCNSQVPETWRKVAYPSTKPLGSWIVDLLARVLQLDSWAKTLTPPKVVWLSGFFNPQAYLTAIMQTTARKNGWALDSMVLQTEVTKKMSVDEIEAPSKDGTYISGFYMEGARWDISGGVIENHQNSAFKDLYSAMPIILIRASNANSQEYEAFYQCPVYLNQERASNYVFTANLKTKQAPSVWTLSGVALLMEQPE